MEKERTEKAIIDIRSIGLSREEKHSLLTRIVGEDTQTVVKISSFTLVSARRLFVQKSWVTTVVMAALILMLAGGSVAFAAEVTLPGDTLYAFKVGVTEPLRESLAFTSSGKVYLEELKIERRLHEAATLEAQGRLSGSIREQIQTQIEDSGRKIVTLIGKILK